MLVTELYAQLGFEFDQAAFSRVQNALKGVHSGLAAIAAVAAGAALGFAAMVQSTVNSAKEIENTSEALGLSTDQLQDWRNAARFAGVESNAFVVGIRHLANMMHEARLGNANVAYSLFELGVHGRDANQALLSVADTVSKMPDGLEKTARVNEVFGARMGSKLIPILNLGRKGIQQYMDAARELGTTLDKDTIKRADEAYLSNIRLKMAFEGLRNALVGPFLASANKWRDALTEWIKLHRAVIATGFKEWLERLQQVFKGTGAGLEVLIGIVKMLWHDLKFALDYVLIPFVKFLDQFVAKSKAAQVLLGILAGLMLLLFAPVETAVLAVLAAVDDLYVYLEGGDSMIGNVLIPAFQKLFHEKLPLWLKEAKDAAIDFFTYLNNATERYMEENIPLWKSLADKLAGFRDKLAEKVGDTLASGGQLPTGLQTLGAALGPIAGTANMSTFSDPNANYNFSGSGGKPVQVNFTVGDINVTGGGDPQANATAINQVLQDHTDNLAQQVQAQLGSPPVRNN